MSAQVSGQPAITGFLLASYTTKEYALSHGAPYPNDWLNRVKRRDLRLFVIACGGLVGSPHYAMVEMGALSHLVIGGILATAWRSPQMDPDVSPPLVAHCTYLADRGVRMVSYDTMIPRWANKSSTSRKLMQYLW